MTMELYSGHVFKKNDSIPAIAFDHSFFENNDDRIDILKNIFNSHGIKNITVVPEFNKMYNEDDWITNSPEELLDDLFCSEQFVYDASHTWLVYSSHEATISFAGEWIVKEIIDQFPEVTQCNQDVAQEDNRKKNYFYPYDCKNENAETVQSDVSFDDLDFGVGEIKYNSGFLYEEDILQVQYPNNIVLDLGWYGENGFILYLIRDYCWEVPVLKIMSRDENKIRPMLQKAINYIETEALTTKKSFYGGLWKTQIIEL